MERIKTAYGEITEMTEVKTQNKFVFCKHKDRDTWEIPGGHREKFPDGNWENIIATAKREMHEETGALEFNK
jgi:8-oxo-dGTP diphosphatase